ncbi:MAG: hypothetical protein V3W41_00845 [Planctomycetota bacterium]
MSLSLDASDDDVDDSLSFSVMPMLSFANLTDNGNGTATLDLTPQIGDQGDYEMTIRVTDDASDSKFKQEIIRLVVVDVSAMQISGIVLDSVNLLPVADAIVTLQATTTQTTTAADGSYTTYIDPAANEVLVAAKRGFYNEPIDTQTGGTAFLIQLRPVHVGNNVNYQFLDPLLCAVCHPNQVSEWQNSIMAKAGQNMWMHDVYAGNGTPGGMGGFVYTRDSVFAGTNPDSVCASCHQPEAWIAAGFSGRVEGPTDANYPSPATVHGVSCETCHKIANVDTTKMNFPGILPESVTYNRPEFGTQVQYGLLPDVGFQLPGFMQPTYQPQLVAEICGTCHQDQTDINQDHTFMGITSEPTFKEWKESPYGDPNSGIYQSCIDCHMPPAGLTEICVNAPVTRDPNTIRSHDIRGTSPAYLENAVDLTMQTTVANGQLNVTVAINNSMTGHHVPTGVSLRNMVLLVQAWEDGQDPLTNPLAHIGSQTIHALGGIGNPAMGYYSGLPGKLFAKATRDINNQGPVFFTEATGFMFDNRIPALGTDTTNYVFVLPQTGTGTIKVRARLIYRRAYRFFVDAKNWTTDGHGNPLADIAAPHYGHLMEEATANLPF